jgi:protein O-GlcNAc transferase
MAPVLANHDRDRVELVAYANLETKHEDSITLRLKHLFDCWTPVHGLSDDDLLLRILSDEIDVLIDLSGYTGLNRLPVVARRAAPVQCHYLGYLASTGLSQMDYWLGDPHLTPLDGDVHFSETVWRLPRIYLGYNTTTAAPAVTLTSATEDQLVLGSFNSLAKLDGRTLALWARALQAIPHASMWLKAKGLTEPRHRSRVMAVFEEHGLPAHRIVLEDATADWSAYMGLYGGLDIALDPVGPWGGGTTTCDALWMGVPVVTLNRPRLPQRLSAAVLHAIGCADWIAESEEAYIEKVRMLALDLPLRQNLRASQREKMLRSPLCDAKDLARALEDAYEAMFDAWWDNKRSPSSAQ